MSTIVQVINKLLTNLGNKTGTTSHPLPFGLLAEKTWRGWIFSQVPDNTDFVPTSFVTTHVRPSVSLTKALTHEQLLALRDALQLELAGLDDGCHDCQ